MSSNEEKEFDSELYDERQPDAVDKHIVQYFGEYRNVFHEIFSSYSTTTTQITTNAMWTIMR